MRPFSKTGRGKRILGHCHTFYGQPSDIEQNRPTQTDPLLLTIFVNKLIFVTNLSRHKNEHQHHYPSPPMHPMPFHSLPPKERPPKHMVSGTSLLRKTQINTNTITLANLLKTYFCHKFPSSQKRISTPTPKSTHAFHAIPQPAPKRETLQTHGFWNSPS